MTADLVIPMPDACRIVIRSFNLLLAIWVAVFSLTSIRRTPLPYQRIRFLGLGLLALTVALRTSAIMHTDVTIATIGYAISLSISTVGTLGFLRQTTHRKQEP